MRIDQVDHYTSIIAVRRRCLRICVYTRKYAIVSLCWKTSFLIVNLQDIAQISQPAKASHLHSLGMYICLWYEYGCQSRKDRHNSADSLVLCCALLQHQAPSTLD